MSSSNRICLNMIVKNESRIIIRLLESVINLVDGYCICDTGSTDNTIELIENFFKSHNKTGKIVIEPFRDFGYNRSFALNAAFENMQSMDYLLLMDADMILTGNFIQDIDNFKKGIVCDYYHVCQGTPSYYYKNVRFVKNNGKFSYWGVTHEYVNAPNGAVLGTFDNELIFINDIGDGGAKSDKFERDIRLLTKGLEGNPNNDRYTFYLANSLKDAGHTERSIEMYKNRIQIGGWDQEVWYSYFNIGHCYMKLREPEKAIATWLDGYEYYPRRLEGLYEIIKYYRENGKNALAYWYYIMASESNKKWGASNDYLFIQKDVYDYKLDYEMTIIGYYQNHAQININNLCMNVLKCNYVEDHIVKNLMSNYKFYSKKLYDENKKHDIINILQSIPTKIEDCVSSTPSFVFCEDYLLVNVRYVNYMIDEKGNYINKEAIKTINIIYIVDKQNPKIINEFILNYDKSMDNYYVGLEDVRLFTDGCKVFYNANRGLSYNSMKVEHGEIDIATNSTLNSVLIEKPNQEQLEKNWVMIPSKNDVYMIYNWYPYITIGKVNGNKFEETHKIKSPHTFRNLRGSTNGILVNNEIWILCHCVSYEDRRYYYNMVITLNKDTYEVTKYTPYFTFEGQAVEYSLGFQYMEDDTFLIGYSLYDKETKYMNISRNYFLENMIQQ